MSNILIRPPQLRSTAETLRQKSKLVRTALEHVDKLLNELKADRFEGARAAALRSRYAARRDKIFQAPQLIEKFAQELETTAQVFEKADRAAAAGDGSGAPVPTPVPTPAKPQPIAPGPVDPVKQVTPTNPTGPVANIGLNQNNYTDVMGDNGMTIKQVGCLITDVAMIGRFLGKDISTVDVNTYLRDHGGYAPNSSNLYWGKAADYLNSIAGTHGSFTDVSTANVNDALSSGNPVIIHIPSTTSDGHWVLAVPGGDGSSIVAYDPFTGKQTTVSPDVILGAKAFNLGNPSL